MISKSISNSISTRVSKNIPGIIDPLPALIERLFGQGQQGAFFIPRPQVLGQQVLYQSYLANEIIEDSLVGGSDGDPIGTVLDASSGYSLGAEQIDPSAWDTPGYWENENGTLLYTHPVNASPPASQALPPSSINTYLLSLNVEYFEHEDSAPVLNAATGDPLRPEERVNLISKRGGGETKSYAIPLIKFSERIGFGSNRYVSNEGRFYGRIYDISLRPLPGNHFRQEVSSRRSIYRTDGVLHWAEADGTDDDLMTEVPATNITNTGAFISVAGRFLSDDLGYIAALTNAEINRVLGIRVSAGSFQVATRSNEFQVLSGPEYDSDLHVFTVILQTDGTLVFRVDGVSYTADTSLASRDINFASLFSLNGIGNAKSAVSGAVYGLYEPTEEQTTEAESYLAQLAGITL